MQNILDIKYKIESQARSHYSNMQAKLMEEEAKLEQMFARKKELEFLKNIDATLILYEAPHRINKTLKDLGNILGNNFYIILFSFIPVITYLYMYIKRYFKIINISHSIIYNIFNFISRNNGS